MPFRVFREPSLFDSLFLCKQFVDAPQAGETHDAEQSREDDSFHEYRPRERSHPRHKEYPPAAHTHVIFALYDNGVEQPDDEKGSQSDNNAREMVYFNKIHF